MKYLLATMAALVLLPLSGVRAGQRSMALIVGNNAPVDATLDTLQFADDDAFRYERFFRFVADEVTLLARADRDSTSLYGGIAAEAPTRDNVIAALDEVSARAVEATGSGDSVTVYFVFTGHGNYDAEGRGYLHLEDGKLTTRDLFYHLIRHSPDFRLVLLVDACNAGFLVKSRGEGEERRPAGPSGLELERFTNVGLILSSSSTGEVREWGRYLSGIFSHQVRSGLSGAADVNSDGRISFPELAAFVDAANQGVSNPSLRLTPYIRPPLSQPDMPVIDFAHSRFPRFVRMEFDTPARVTVLDSDLVRYADFHLRAGYPVNIGLPGGREYFVSVNDRIEYDVPADSTGTVDLSVLEGGESSSLASRGVDEYYVRHLFSVAFGPDVAADYLANRYGPGLVFTRAFERPWYENGWAWAATGTGLVLLGIGATLEGLALAEANAAADTPWGDERDLHNDRSRGYNTFGIASLVAGGGALAAGTALFLLDRPVELVPVVPDLGPGISVRPLPGGANVEMRF
jgi:hypothetical protein